MSPVSGAPLAGPPARLSHPVAGMKTYSLRNIPDDAHAGAAARAAREGRTLHHLFIAALYDYASGAWTPGALANPADSRASRPRGRAMARRRREARVTS